MNGIAKIYEKVICQRLMNFMKKKKILHENQFAFQKGKSTEDTIEKITGKINQALKNRGIYAACSIDLKKAFDTVKHDVLLSKMRKLGIRGKAWKLMESYLKNRRQYVIIGEKKSEVREMKTGIPQGANLGPMLFLIYTSDLNKITENGDIITFADDTIIGTENKTIKRGEENLQEEIKKIEKWVENNGMEINQKKSEYIVFIGEKNPERNKIKETEIKIGSETKKAVEKIKYLGVWMDHKMKWREEINNKKKKIRTYITALKTAAKYLTRSIMRTILYSMIISRLRYAITAWSQASKTEKCGLQKTYNILVRIALKRDKMEPAKTTFEEAELPNITNLLMQRRIKKGLEYKNNTRERPNWYKLWKEKEMQGMRTRRDREDTLKENNQKINKYGEALEESKLPKIWNFAIRNNIIKKEELEGRSSKNFKKDIEKRLRKIQFDNSVRNL